MAELLRCPFCGGRSESWELPESGEFQVGCSVACAESAWCDTVEEAAAWWNRRADASELETAQADKGEAVAVEREACAKVARECFDDPQAESDPDYVANAIRARALPASVKEG